MERYSLGLNCSPACTHGFLNFPARNAVNAHMGIRGGRASHVTLALAMVACALFVAIPAAQAAFVQIGTVGWTPPIDDINRPDSVAVTSTGDIITANAETQTVRKVSALGVVQWSIGGVGSGNGQLDSPFGVAVDSADNVYVADTGNDRIQKFNGATGAYMSQFGISGSANGELNNPTGIDVAPNGTIYVVDAANNRIQYFTSAGVYSGKFGSFGGAGGQFNNPWDIAVSPNGTVYVTEVGGMRIQQLTAAGVFLDMVAPTRVFYGVDVAADETPWAIMPTQHQLKHYAADLQTLTASVPATTTASAVDGKFDLPRDVTIDAGGNLIAADYNNFRIQTFDSAGVFASKFGNIGSGNGEFSAPNSVAKDSGGNLFVTDEYNDRIEKFDSGGVWVASFGASGTGNGQFDRPTGVAVDASNNIWVVDSENNRVQKLNGTTGAYMTKFGAAGTGNGQFDTPYDVAIDSTGKLYVSDSANNRIQKFTSAGAYSAKWGSLGTGDVQFDTPRGIAVDDADELWVADSGNDRIQHMSVAGVYINEFGTYGFAAGELNNPYDVDYGDDDMLYVANFGNNRVEKFSPAGVLQSSFGGWGTTVTKAKTPSSVTYASGTSIYAVDRGNRRVVKLDGDTNPPVNGSISYPDGFAPAETVDINIDKGIDTESGISTWVLQRDEGALGSEGSCDFSGSWTSIEVNPVPVFEDATIAEGNCYMYRLVVNDNAENQAIYEPADAAVVMLDFTDPSVFTLTAPTPDAPPAITNPGGASGPGCESTPAFDTLGPTLEWSASTDTSLDHYELAFGALPDEIIPFGATSFVLPAQAAGEYPWSVTAYDFAGHSRIGTLSPMTVGLDGADPTASLSAPADDLWVADATPDLSWTASDDLCLTRVKVTIDAAQADVLPETATTYTPAALGQGVHTWKVTAYDSAGKSKDSTTRSVGVDTIQPGAFSLTSPSPAVAIPAITNGGSAPSCESSPAYGSLTPTLAWGASADVALDRYEVSFGLDPIVTRTAAQTSAALASHAEGFYDWHVTAYDQVDNSRISTQNPLNVGLDGALPTVSSSVSPTPYGTTTPTFDFTAADSLCLVRVRIKIDGNSVAVLDPTATEYTSAALAQGAHTLQVVAFDSAGKFVQTAVMNFSVDTVAPTAFTLTEPAYPAVPAITNPPGGAGPVCENTPSFDSLTPTLDWSDSVDINLSKYTVTFGIDAPQDVAAPTSQYVLSSHAVGNYTWSVQAFDTVGNAQTATPATMDIALDGADPTATLNSPANAGIFSDSTPTLNFTVADDQCLTRIEIKVDGGVVDVVPATASTYTVATLADGPHTWELTAYDNAGNSTDSAQRTFTVDTTLPQEFTLDEPSAAALPAITSPPGGIAPDCESVASFTTTTPNLGWTASIDATLDHYELNWGALATVELDPDTLNYVLPAQLPGTYSWAMSAVDSTDTSMSSNPESVLVGIDAAAPSVAPVAPADDLWVTTTPTLSWAASDDRCLSRISVLIDGLEADVLPDTETSYEPAPLNDGMHTWQIEAIDSAGRSTTSPVREFSVDTDAPSGTIVVPSLPDAGVVPFTGTATDATSGVELVTVRYRRSESLVETTACTAVAVAGSWSCNWSTVEMPNALYTISYTIEDVAGNITSENDAGDVSVDSIAPTVRPQVTVPKYLGSNSAAVKFNVGTNEIFPVTITAKWCGKVVSFTTHKIDKSKLRQGRCRFRIVVRDNANNVSKWSKFMVIDRTKPTFRPLAKHIVMGSTVFIRTRDLVSGVRRGGVTVAVPLMDSNVLKVRAVDRAGNVATTTMRVNRRISLVHGSFNSGLPLFGGFMQIRTDAGLSACFAYNSGASSPFAAASRCKPAVEEVQWRLRRWGFLPRHHGISGGFGFTTLRAVQAFQRSQGLTPVGTVGPKTRDALEKRFMSEF